jgi:hypothetical protein
VLEVVFHNLLQMRTNLTDFPNATKIQSQLAADPIPASVRKAVLVAHLVQFPPGFSSRLEKEMRLRVQEFATALQHLVTLENVQFLRPQAAEQCFFMAPIIYGSSSCTR